MTAAVTVGVCTAGRASLAGTLRSLATQTLPPARVVVADNGEVPTAEAALRAAGALPDLPVAFVHAPARNVSVARNACLDAVRQGGGGLLAFVDDDETAPPRWLAALSSALAPGLAAVFGPTRAVYGEGAPTWMREARLHDQDVPANRGALRTGHCGNCLIDLSHPALAGARFDPAFGRTGGEDTAFFHAAYARGARYAYASDAWVEEPVPPERARLSWLLARKMRAGQSYRASLPDGPLYKAALSGLALPKAACAGLGAVASRDRAGRARSLMRASLHLGVARQALGLSAREHYGVSSRQDAEMRGSR